MINRYCNTTIPAIDYLIQMHVCKNLLIKITNLSCALLCKTVSPLFLESLCVQVGKNFFGMLPAGRQSGQRPLTFSLTIAEAAWTRARPLQTALADFPSDHFCLDPELRQPKLLAF